MSDFIKKIKDEAQALVAAIDQELTVLEGVDGYDPLAKNDADDSSDGEGSTDGDEASEGDDSEHTPSDDTEGGGTPA